MLPPVFSSISICSLPRLTFELSTLSLGRKVDIIRPNYFFWRNVLYHPTTRVLTVLELLQSHGQLTGAQLAARLEVDARTARRYVAMLQDMGVPVESVRGRHGGYRLRPGFKLPPLMFGEEEAVALTLGLLTAKRLDLVGAAPAVEGALAKIERVLPEPLRERVQALDETLAVAGAFPAYPPSEGATLAALALAARQRRRVGLTYTSGGSAESDRLYDPYGLVFSRGRWFVAGYCHLRNDMRVFRLDRVSQVEPLDESFERPEGFDSLKAVEETLAQTPGRWEVEVLLRLSLDEARERVPRAMATLEPVAGGVMMRCRVQRFSWFAPFLVGLKCELVVHSPPELRDALRQLAKDVLNMAQNPGDSD